MKRVLVGMSGGVDSTVSAILLQKQGYEVEGVYMKLHTKVGYHEENFEKARRAANFLGIVIHFLDLEEEFNQSVYSYFIDSYQKGLTPNPCVVCNRDIKFGKMVEFASRLGIEYVATGHYVRCDGKKIYKAKDSTKDQSYFLAHIHHDVLPRLLFPLGEWLKEDVKAFASEIPILQDIAIQKESSEICFVENDYIQILEKYMNINQEGEAINSQGEVVGHHKGYMHYTIGKRRGFYVHGAHDPHFVLDIKPQTNQIVVGKREELAIERIKIRTINLFEAKKTFDCHVKVRYRTQAVSATVSIEGDEGEIYLHQPVYGVAKEQVAVFYDGEELLGGGIIV
ncbi:MAG: thiouridylase [Sulfurovum sp. PC08-66]|jgi:tRNA-specific 2-thiouridylase|nr:MAG: thiouridylase [Sulfurovum sp. PC08-66]